MIKTPCTVDIIGFYDDDASDDKRDKVNETLTKLGNVEGSAVNVHYDSYTTCAQDIDKNEPFLRVFCTNLKDGTIITDTLGKELGVYVSLTLVDYEYIPSTAEHAG